MSTPPDPTSTTDYPSNPPPTNQPINRAERIAPAVYKPTGPSHTHTIILLHGFGTNGQIFGSEFLEKTDLATKFPTVKFIFPSGLRKRMTMWQRAWTKCWFDMASLGDTDLRSEIQVEGLECSAGYIWDIIDEEARVLAESGESRESEGYGRVILGGVSQGCAAGLFTLLGGDRQLGGFIGMGGWMPFESELEGILRIESGEEDDLFEDNELDEEESSVLQSINMIREILSCDYISSSVEGYPDFSSGSWHGRHILNTPVFLGHGDEDEVVSIESGRKMKTILGNSQGLTMNVTWEEYEGSGNGFDAPNVINDIATFLVNELNVPYNTDLDETETDQDSTSDFEGEMHAQQTDNDGDKLD